MFYGDQGERYRDSSALIFDMLAPANLTISARLLVGLSPQTEEDTVRSPMARVFTFLQPKTGHYTI